MIGPKLDPWGTPCCTQSSDWSDIMNTHVQFSLKVKPVLCKVYYNNSGLRTQFWILYLCNGFRWKGSTQLSWTDCLSALFDQWSTERPRVLIFRACPMERALTSQSLTEAADFGSSTELSCSVVICPQWLTKPGTCRVMHTNCQSPKLQWKTQQHSMASLHLCQKM